MKTEKIVSRAIVGFLFAQAVFYGGSKPPMPTNCVTQVAAQHANFAKSDVATTPTLSATPQSAFCNVPLQCEQTATDSSCGVARVASVVATPNRSQFAFGEADCVRNWTARGAYCDWERIEFRNGFAFPVGTNFIDGVTLFAYGELKSNLHCSTSPSSFDFSLPSRISLEPNFSSLTHGLTPSNSYLFAWHNCCVERSATNRVDASIELFDSGAVAATVTPLSTNQPPITIYQPPIPPEGFVGHGQDNAWLAASFPSHYAAITNLGYDTWLDGYIGHNDPNGRYQVKVTVAALPEHGPCYLFCGPYKMVVTSPGTYSFPLEVFEEYRAYTLPTRVPLSFEYDDGYDYPTQPLMAGAPLMAPRSVPDYYIVCRVPDVVIVPSHIPLNQAVGSRISILCNVPNAVWSYYSTVSTNFRLSFAFPSEAEIQTALVSELVVIRMQRKGHECAGIFYIDPAEPWPSVVTNGWDFGDGTNTVNDAETTNETSSAESP